MAVRDQCVSGIRERQEDYLNILLKIKDGEDLSIDEMSLVSAAISFTLAEVHILRLLMEEEHEN